MSRIVRVIRYSISGIAALACGTVIVLGGLGFTTIIIPICGGIALLPSLLILI